MTSAPDNDNQSALTSAYLIRLGKIAEAREAVVEAARKWRDSGPMMQSEETEALYKSITALRAIEQETSNG